MPSQLGVNTGLAPLPFDSRDVFADEIGLAGSAVIPKSFLTEGIPFEPQGDYPFCVSFATCKLVNLAIKAVNGQTYDFSKPFQFFRSGGNAEGSDFRSNLATAISPGCIDNSQLPMPADVYGPSQFNELQQKAATLAYSAPECVIGYMRINPTTEAIQQAIMSFGGVLINVCAESNWFVDGCEFPVGGVYNHGVIAVGWREDGCRCVHDSIEESAAFTGYHYIAADYPLTSIYAIAPLPANWRDLRDTVRAAPFANALSHFSKARNLAIEQQTASDLLAAFTALKNQSVMDAAGRFWTVFINCVSYGNYTVTDCVNYTYAFRRGETAPFDLNQHKP